MGAGDGRNLHGCKRNDEMNCFLLENSSVQGKGRGRKSGDLVQWCFLFSRKIAAKAARVCDECIYKEPSRLSRDRDGLIMPDSENVTIGDQYTFMMLQAIQVKTVPVIQSNRG
jgi:hypothetical protein